MTTFIIADERALSPSGFRRRNLYGPSPSASNGTRGFSHERYRRVKVEVERTGDDSLFVDFQRRFKQDEADRYRRFKGQC